MSITRRTFLKVLGTIVVVPSGSTLTIEEPEDWDYQLPPPDPPPPAGGLYQSGKLRVLGEGEDALLNGARVTLLLAPVVKNPQAMTMAEALVGNVAHPRTAKLERDPIAIGWRARWPALTSPGGAPIYGAIIHSPDGRPLTYHPLRPQYPNGGDVELQFGDVFEIEGWL